MHKESPVANFEVLFQHLIGGNDKPQTNWAQNPPQLRNFVCRVILPLETLPPSGDPSGGIVYLRIVLSPEEASQLVNIT
jgi:hypothetical protein